MVVFLGLLSFLAWLGLLFFRGQFWRANQVLPAAPDPEELPEVAAIIPARDEAETVGAVIAAHGAARYDGELQIFLADDHSSDGTADVALAAKAARALHIVDVPDLPDGWSGKLWALRNGIEAAKEAMPDARYFLFTDADIEVSPSLLRKLVAHAEHKDLALTSIMAQLDGKGFWGGLLVPAFIFFFQKLYPFPLINDPKSPVAGAAGGVILIRRDALEAIGGMEAMRDALIDDCTLAQRVKALGRPIGLYLSSSFGEATSLRENASYEAMESMVARSAYTQLGYSPLALVGTLMGMAFLYLVPWLGTIMFFTGATDSFMGPLTWGLMGLAYFPTIRRYKKPFWQSFSLPVTGALYGWFTWLSAYRHWRGKGGRWKGRTYPSKSS